jgi:exopolyphosphatase / guanosine-5'-triphosphate,3'-diphosphate pyrophosphatase
MNDDLTAVVDLGSNSFHLLLARQRGADWIALERAKEKVQLARGLTAGTLSDAALARGLACIERFAQRLAAVPRTRLRVVGTCALRDAHNSDEFLRRAERILDAPVEVLTGAKEAELIFLGVSHALDDDLQRRLVIDIGGGSSEFAVGHSFAPHAFVSANLGCVTLTEQFFDNERSLPLALEDARACAAEMVAALKPELAGHGWDAAIGTSGTVESIEHVLAANGWSRQHITRAGLDRLLQALADRHWTAPLGMPGLAPSRVDIFPAGVAAMAAIFDVLGIETMSFCRATLLDGVLFDLVGRRSAENVQERTIRHWRERFDADAGQVARVRRTALRLFGDVRTGWSLDDDAADLLRWAAELHEIGLEVSSNHSQRHGAYLIQNGDLRGISAEHQRALALLVRCHRGGIPAFAFGAYEGATALRLQHLAVLLRLAVILERTRRDADSPEVSARVDGARLVLTFDRDWLDAHALSRAELASEHERLKRIGIELETIARTPRRERAG